MSGWKSDTEKTSKQKKLNRGNRLGSEDKLPTTPEEVPEISILFLQTFSLIFFVVDVVVIVFSFLFLLLFLTF